MKYSELINFEPIETVIVIRKANEEEYARDLVRTFVISERMSEQLTSVVIPQLQFAHPMDNKGLLIVGNYGTGKSHMMAVISAIAERYELTDLLTDEKSKDQSKKIAGMFKVIRTEVGSTTMALRDIICGVLEHSLSEMGVSFPFPSTDEVHENKTSFIRMMSCFQKKYPDQGLLLVVDELLDYLKTRKDQELGLDLSFLREVGEVCKGSRFRFIAGLQESLFDSPRFQFVADTLRRVKDRFTQVRIARDDVAYVVSERLLKKDARQKALIREHLVEFAPFYGNMNERIEDYVNLFPVHPAYLEVFERVFIAEKREVLKSLSRLIRELIDKDVPDKEPGLVSYDSYWQLLRDDPSFRSDNEIKEVISKSSVLEDRVQQAYTRPQYKEVALRVIHALSVHRLTTSDIYSPIGATAEELRDDLCLLLPVPEKEAGFLHTVIESVLKEIVRTVSGQFLSYNKDNGQYYIDLKKDIDFDSLIERKAESLDNSHLDRYYYDALRRLVLEDPEAPAYVSGYRIWEYEIEWQERRVGRSGYLFFGAPNQRSTAQPPRDFYLYFLQPYDPPSFRDEKKPDEVFFRFKGSDESFERTLKLYAGAREQAATSSGANKRIYEDKSQELLRSLMEWLREKLLDSFEVSYEGRSVSLARAIRSTPGMGRNTLRDIVNITSSKALSNHFENLYPEYPIFTTILTRQNREQACQDALRWISGSIRTKQGTAILDGLELLDGDALKPSVSRYAKNVTEALSKKGNGQVLNRSEIVQAEAGIEFWARFRLEPEFLAVVLAALVHSGDIVLSLAGKKVDASSIDVFSRIPIGDVIGFKHIERPKDLPLAPLQELCGILGIPKALMVHADTRDDAVAQMLTRTKELLDCVVTMQTRLSEFSLWGRSLLTTKEQEEYQKRLSDMKALLESLQPFNTPGRLKNFPYDTDSLDPLRVGKTTLKDCQDLGELVRNLSQITAYLSKAEAVIERDSHWLDSVNEEKSALLTKLQSAKYRNDTTFHRQLGQTLEQLKNQYQDTYLSLHAKYRLGANDEKKMVELKRDKRLSQLQKLSVVEMMPSQQLREFENKLCGLKPCYSLTKQDLVMDPVCPYCSFRPAEETSTNANASGILSDLVERLDLIITGWTDTLLNNLSDPTVMTALDLLPALAKAEIQAFEKRRELPEVVDAGFIVAIREVLSGLQKVSVSSDNIKAALVVGGIPCTLGEIQERFEKYLSDISRGKDRLKVRIVVE